MGTGSEQLAGVLIRPLQRSDLRFAARLHAHELADGFFGRLGEGFLRPYYWSFARSPHGIALAAEVDGTPVGVVVGTTNDAAHYRHVVRSRWWHLGSRGVVALARRPRLLIWFFQRRARRYCRGAVRLLRARQARSSGVGATPGPAATVSRSITGHLTHVAVAAERQGSGAGAALVKGFAAHAESAGCEVLLVVTRSGPDSKAPFYEKLGWRPAGQTTDLDGVPFDRLRRSADARKA